MKNQKWAKAWQLLTETEKSVVDNVENDGAISSQNMWHDVKQDKSNKYDSIKLMGLDGT